MNKYEKMAVVVDLVAMHEHLQQARDAMTRIVGSNAPQPMKQRVSAMRNLLYADWVPNFSGSDADFWDIRELISQL